MPDSSSDLSARVHTRVFGAPDAKALRDKNRIIIRSRIDVGEGDGAEIGRFVFEIAAEKEVF